MTSSARGRPIKKRAPEPSAPASETSTAPTRESYGTNRRYPSDLPSCQISTQASWQSRNAKTMSRQRLRATIFIVAPLRLAGQTECRLDRSPTPPDVARGASVGRCRFGGEQQVAHPVRRLGPGSCRCSTAASSPRSPVAAKNVRTPYVRRRRSFEPDVIRSR